MLKSKEYLKTFFIFFPAVVIFYSAQTYLFSETGGEVKAETVIPVEDSFKTIDAKLDAYVTHVQQFVADLLGKNTVSRGWVTIILVPSLLVVTFLVGLLLRLFIVKPLLHWWASKTEKVEVKKIILRINKVLRPLLWVLAIRVALVPVEAYFSQRILWLRAPIKVLIIITSTIVFQGIVYGAMSIWGNKLAQKTETNIDDQLLPLLIGLTRGIVVAFGFLFAVSSLGVNMAPLVASLGAVSFAMGFAVKDSLSNFVGGIFLVLDNAFNVDDKVDIPGIGIGFIYEIGLRTTKLRTFDNEVIVIPNNILMNKQYKSFRLPDIKIRVVIDFTTKFGVETDDIKYKVLQTLNSIEGLLDDPAPAVDFTSMSEYALKFQAKFFVDDYQLQYTKMLEATDKIYQTLKEQNLEPAYPVYRIRDENQS